MHPTRNMGWGKYWDELNGKRWGIKRARVGGTASVE